ncbi:MAG: hypothetical protein ACOCP8_08220 [archaeon]
MTGRNGALDFFQADKVLINKDFSPVYETLKVLWGNFPKKLSLIENNLKGNYEFERYCYKRIRYWILRQDTITTDILKLKNQGKLNY